VTPDTEEEVHMAPAITLNLVAATFLLPILVATMRLPFKFRGSPASAAQLRAWRGWLDPAPSRA
jgi:hypothetical protein